MITEGEAEFCSENPDVYAVNDALHCSLSMVVDLESRLQNLDALLLTGRPNAIADAAKAMELSLSAAEPTFQSAGDTGRGPASGCGDAAASVQSANRGRGRRASPDGAPAVCEAQRFVPSPRSELGPWLERVGSNTSCTRLGREWPIDRGSLTAQVSRGASTRPVTLIPHRWPARDTTIP
jgi:hypothetical protein